MTTHTPFYPFYGGDQNRAEQLERYKRLVVISPCPTTDADKIADVLNQSGIHPQQVTVIPGEQWRIVAETNEADQTMSTARLYVAVRDAGADITSRDVAVIPSWAFVLLHDSLEN